MNKIKKIVSNFIKNDISFKSRNNQNYRVSRNLGQMLETICGAEIYDNRTPWLWKRKTVCPLIDDPELNALAAEIVRHEQEDFTNEKEEN